MQLDDLKPAPYNPRTITQHALDGLTYSMDRFGDLSGIVFNKRTGYLVAGHQRVRALKEKYGNQLKLVHESGLNALITTPGGGCYSVRLVDFDETEEKAANLAANATHITGNFTLEVNSVIDDVMEGLPDVASSLEFDMLKINVDDIDDMEKDDDSKHEPKSITCPECEHKWVVK